MGEVCKWARDGAEGEVHRCAARARLVLVAFVTAAPIAYYAMRRWLQDFAYRIELGPWLFVGAGILALMIVLGTVSYQAVRAALSDPVDSLRYE